MRKPTALQGQDYAVMTYYHTAAEGTTEEDLLSKDYWTHVAARLLPGNRIEVFAEDGSFWAMLLVRAAARLEADVCMLQFVDTSGGDDMGAGEDDGLYIKYRGPTARYSVLRKSDNGVLKDGFQTKSAAQQWRGNHARNMAA